jgi:hypothetical protein
LLLKFAEIVNEIAPHSFPFYISLLLGCIIPNVLFSLLYCTDTGLYFLDVIDFYMNFVMLLVGFLEAFGAAWANGILDLYQSIGAKATLSYMMTNFIPVLIACGFWFSSDSKVWTGFVALFAGWFTGLLVTHYFLMERIALEPDRWTVRSIWWECGYGNICRLRDQIQPVIGPIPFIWVILMKSFIPHVLIILFLNLCFSENGPGNYEGYAIRPYQLLGLLFFVFAIFLFFVGILVPEVYEPLAMPQTKVVTNALVESSSEENEPSFSEPRQNEDEKLGLNRETALNLINS